MTDDEVAVRLAAIDREIRDDPDFRRELDDMVARRHLGKPLTPRRVRGEQLTYALMMAAGAMPLSPVGNLAAGRLKRNGRDRSRLVFASALGSSTAYLWRRDLMLLAKSMPLPKHVIGDDLFPHDFIYWTVDNSLDLLNPGDGWSDAKTEAFIVLRMANEYIVGMIGEATHADRGLAVVLAVEVVPKGSRYPEDVVGGIMGDCLSFAAFVNSPFVSVDKVRPPTSNKVRRRYGPRIGDPFTLNVVNLRAEVREAVAVERGEGPLWKQRWLVRGHYRAQWYPSTKSHKVIWVAPYLKGPEDAPFKQPIYSVVR